MSKLRQMTVFMHIVQLGSITKAAEKLSVSKSVISQHLKQLETDLAVPLLIRTTRRQQLTSNGHTFYQQCCQMHELAEQAWTDMAEQQTTPQGRIKITAPHALMEHLVLPALSKTFNQHSQVELELICHDGQLDLIQEGIDIAIRVGSSKNSSLKQKRIGQFQDILCSSKHLANSRHNIEEGNFAELIDSLQKSPYVANHWQDKHIHHSLINTEDSNDTLDLYFTPQHRANTLPTCINMIEQGFGLGIVPDFIMHSYQSSLQPILPNYRLANTNVYALHPYQSAMPIAVKMAIQAIAEGLQS